jgi:WD40 repeat protein
MPCCRRCRLIRWIIACLAALAWLSYSSAGLKAADDAPALLPVAEIKHPKPVDFQREILPIFKKNCLACHNATDAEGKLVLETPQTIAKGGDTGLAVVPKHPEKSLLLERARGGGDGIMPPEDNKVAAKPLTAAELGLLKLWIAQGAGGSVRSGTEVIKWQPLPPGVNPVFAVALTADGQFAACGRANQIFIYQVPTGRVIGRLTDPALLKSGIYTQPGVADLDLIQSLAFNPDASILASGGYRTIKLWRRSSDKPRLTLDKLAAQSPLAASADGKWLAAADADHSIRLVDAASGKTLQKLAGHGGAISSLDFSADGTRLCSGSLDKSVRLWSVPQGKQLGLLELPGPVTAAVLVDGGKQVAAASGEPRIWIGTWPAEDQKKALAADTKKDVAKKDVAKKDAAKKDAGKKDAGRYLTGHGKPVTALAALHKNPNQLVSAAADGQVILWDIASGKQVRQFKHGGAVAALAVRPDDERIASAGADKVTKLWSTRDGKLIAELRGDLRVKARADEATRSLTLAKNSLTEAKAESAEAEKTSTAEADNVKKATDALAAAEKALPPKVAAYDKQAAEKKAADLAASADEAAKVKAERASMAADQQAAAAEAAHKKASQALVAAAAAAKKSPKDKAAGEAAAAAEKEATAAAAKLKAAKLAQTAAKKQLTQLDAKLKQSTANVATVAKALETAEQEKKSATTTKTAATKALASATAAAAKAKDRIPAAKAEVTAVEKQVQQAEAALAAARTAATAAELPFHAAAFSADGLELATGNAASQVHTWSAESGVALNAFECPPGAVRGVAFAGDRRLAASADGQALIWDTLPDWQWYQTLGTDGQLPVDRVTALDFSPDGKLLASGGGAPSRSGELKLWNVATGSLVRDLPDAHSDTVLGVRFSPDGQLLASCGTDKFLKVFAVGNGKFVRAFEGHTHHVLGVSWQSDGRTLASAGADNVVKVWDFATGEQKRTIQGFTKEVTSINYLGETPNALATSGDKSIRVVRTTDGGTVRSFSGSNDFVYAGAASIDGRIIIAAGQDSVLRSYNADNGQTLRNFEPPPAPHTAAAK